MHVVVDDPDGRGHRDGHEHAQDAGQAEAGQERHDDQDRRQLDRVAHHLRENEVEDEVRDHEVGQHHQQPLLGAVREADQDRRDRAQEWTQVGNQAGDPGQEAQRQGIGQAQHFHGHAGGDADHAGDHQLALHVGEEHPLGRRPHLVEVGAVVAGHQLPHQPRGAVAVHRKQEGHDQHQQDLERRGQRGDADADRVPELAEQEVAEVLRGRVDGLGQVNPEAHDLQLAALQLIEPGLGGGRDRRHLSLEAGHLLA